MELIRQVTKTIMSCCVYRERAKDKCEERDVDGSGEGPLEL